MVNISFIVTLISVFILFTGFSIPAEIFFYDDFERGLALNLKPYEKTDSKLVLAPCENVQDWKLGGGAGSIESNKSFTFLPFKYASRKDNVLYGVSGLDHHLPKFSKVKTSSLDKWNILSPSQISLVSPGIHGAFAAKIHFQQTQKHVFINSTVPPTQNLWVRFNIRFSRDALSEFPRKIVWFHSLSAKGKGILRIGIKRNLENGSMRFCLRTHLDVIPKQDIFIIDSLQVAENSAYCLEYHYKAVQNQEQGILLYVNGRNAGKYICNSHPIRGPASFFQFGGFSSNNFSKGFFLIDDIAFSSNRQAPFPLPPELISPSKGGAAVSFRPDFRIKPRDSVKAYQIQIITKNKTPFENTFSSNIRTDTLNTLSLPLSLQPGNDYFWSARVKNKFGNWSDWAPRFIFTTKGPVSGSDIQSDKIRNIYFTEPDKEKPLSHLIRGNTFDLHIDLGQDKPSEEIALNFNHYSYSFYSHTKNTSFHEQQNFMVLLNLKEKKLYCQYEPEHPILAEVTGKTFSLVDDSKKTFGYYQEREKVLVRIRTSSKAKTGPWRVLLRTNDSPQVIEIYDTTFQMVSPQMEKALKKRNIVFLLYGILAVFLLILLLFISKKMRRKKTGPSAQPSPLAQKVIQIIEQEYPKNDFNIQILADKMFMNRKRLSKIFNQELGMSFPKYLNKVRVEAAKKQLLESQNRISDIAYSVGYENVIHFNAIFKNLEKCTPKQFREKTLKT
jgi:AraC-like DNA-binding protein